MAARENQGLQIAVMIFFLLVVLLAVTTYVFFKSSDDKAQQIVGLNQQMVALQGQAASTQTEINRLKVLMGFATDMDLGTTDEPGTIEAEFSKDIEKYAVGFDGDARAYRQLLEHLFDANKKIALAEAAAKQREQELLAKLEKLEEVMEKAISQFNQGVKKAETDLASERTNFNQERSRVTEAADKVAKQLDSQRNQMDDSVAKHTAELKRIGGQLQKVTQINAQIQERIKKSESEGVEVPDGRVTWVNQGTNTVWINIGEADGLKRQTVFSVYPVDQNQVVLAEKKGSIEVTRISDRHLAEARILEDDLANPILPGDKIHSPVWHRGRRDGFALAGFMDINGDGRSDRDRVRDLIIFNGGDIHAELNEDGKITGKLEATTRYLILGDAPTAQSGQDLIDAYSRLTGQARELSIDTISVNKFVSQMGYQPDQRTVQLGRGANPDDFKAQPQEGVLRRSTGSTSEQFQKRARPASTF